MAAIDVRLARVRIARRLSQQQVAERAGVRRATISDLERGKSQGIDFETLAKLCEALEVQPSEILCLGGTEGLRLRSVNTIGESNGQQYGRDETDPTERPAT